MSYMPGFGLGTGDARVKQDKGSAFPKFTSLKKVKWEIMQSILYNYMVFYREFQCAVKLLNVECCLP